MARIPALEPPFTPDVEAQLATIMPAGMPPIGLFRTFARNLPMTIAMSHWGRYELGRFLSLTLREREIVILRTCARIRRPSGTVVPVPAGRTLVDAGHRRILGSCVGSGYMAGQP